jgi:zinc protease
VPGHPETLVSIATDPEATNTQVEVDWKLPAEEEGTVAAFRRSLKEQLYARMLNSRLAELAQKADPPFIGAGANVGSFVRGSRIHSLGAAVQTGGAEQGLQAILTEARRVYQHGFTRAELERERTNLMRALERTHAERDRTESSRFAAAYVRSFLTGEVMAGIEEEYALAQQVMPGISLDEINEFARALVPDRDRVIIMTAPQRDDVHVPTGDALLAVVEGMRGMEVAAYEDVTTEEPLVGNLPQAGRIVAERAVPGLDATLLELSNGARVYLKRTNFQNDQVLMGAWSPGGLSLVSDELYPSGAFAAQLVALSGLGSFDAIQLQRALTGRAASVQAAPGEFSEGLAGSASPQDLETLFKLTYLHFTAPRNDSTAYESFMTRIRAAIANRDASPQAAFSDTFAITFWQDHPRARPQTAEFLDQIDRHEAFRIFQDRFADAGDFSFAFVGAFDDAAIRPLIETWLASLPATGRVEAPADNGMRPVRGVVEKTVRRGLEPQAQTRITFSGELEYSRENRLVMALLRDVVETRLRDILREEMGGTYGVNVAHSAQRLPEPRYLLSIQFGAAPDRLEELVAAVFSELERLKRDGPDPTTLANVKEQQRRAQETSMQRNEYWLSALLREAETGEPAAGVMDLPQRLEAVTADQIRDAARRWYDMSNYVRVSLLPER